MRARLRNQGRDPSLDWHQHAEIGFSCRLSDINCALGISQLARIERTVAKRQKLAESYDRDLQNIGEIIRPALSSSVGRISWFVYPVRLAAEFSVKDRDLICQSLARKGIASGRYFAPLHQQPVLGHPFAKNPKGWGAQGTTSLAGKNRTSNLKGWGGQTGSTAPSSSAMSDNSFTFTLPQTELVAERVIALPFFNELTEAEIHEVCGALEESIHELRRKT